MNDEISALTAIGFTFTYNGIDYINFKVSSNGYVNLRAALTQSSPDNTLSTKTINEILAPLWDDLETNTGGSIGYELTGSSGSYILKIEFNDMDFSGYGTSMNYQVWLYEATYKVEFWYGDMGTWTGQSASIGINDESDERCLSITPGITPTSSTTANDAIATNDHLTSGLIYSFTKGSNWSWWKGVTSTDWATASNWYIGAIPTTAQNVTITRDKSNYPIIDESANANNMVLGNGAAITITTGANLTVNGDMWVGGGASGQFTLDDGTLTIANDLACMKSCLVDIDGGTMDIQNNWKGTNRKIRGTIELSGGTLSVANECQFSNFQLNGFMKGNFQLTVGNSFWNTNEGWSEISGGTIILTGSYDGTGLINATPGGTDAIVYNLIMNGPGNNFQMSSNYWYQGVIVNNDFSVVAGTVKTIFSGYNLDKFEVLGTFSLADGTLFQDGMEATDTYNVNNFSFAEGSTYKLYGTTQNIPSATFGDLKVTTAGVKTTTGNATIAGDLSIEAGEFIIDSGHTVTVSGSVR